MSLQVELLPRWKDVALLAEVLEAEGKLLTETVLQVRHRPITNDVGTYITPSLPSAVSGGGRRSSPHPDGALLRGAAGPEQELPGSAGPVAEGDAADSRISLRSGLHGAETLLQPAASQVTMNGSLKAAITPPSSSSSTPSFFVPGSKPTSGV